MAGQNRIYGLMAGITIGFAVWGSVQVQPAAGSAGTEAPVTAGAEKDRSAVRAGTEIPAAAEASAQDELGLHALSAVLMDGDSGRILYEKDGDVRRPMASTTKIMTCILALENGSRSEVCTVSQQAASQPKVHLGAPAGTQFYLGDLLYSLMLESHNDAAVVIAEQIGGSVEGFAAMMNQKARDIGCRDTCFLTPNGLDAAVTDESGTERVHSTTAAELAAILRYCITESPKREEFLAITRTANYSFTDVEKKRSYSCTNHNALLSMMDGVLTGKTGFTGGAGYSYVAALEDDGRTFVLALLGCGWPPHKTYKWADARKLFGYGKEHYTYRDVYEEPPETVLPVEGGVRADWRQAAQGGALSLLDEASVRVTAGPAGEERRLELLLAEDEQVERRLELPKRLSAPVRAGEVVGCCTYLLDGKPVRVYPLYAGESVRRRSASDAALQAWYLFSLPVSR